MFDIAWSELGLVAVVALVVIGPKDLPKVLRTVGQWTSKARSMAREFQSGLDDMVREAELEDLRKAAKDVSSFSLENEIKKTVDPDGAIGGDLAYWYGRNGALTGIGVSAAQQIIGMPGFGSEAQSLREFSGLQDGLIRLG